MNINRKAILIKKLDQEFPLSLYTGVGALYTTVRRMKAEKERNVPVAWRIGSAISVETGKRGNEMHALQWNKFYTDLCKNLKRNYPDLYESLFSKK